MTEELIIELMQLMMRTCTVLCAPVIITVVVVGTVVNIIQTVTQLKDQALLFVPKCIACGIVFIITIPWYIQEMEHFWGTIMSLIERATL